MRTLRLVRRDVLVGLRAFSPVAISLSLTIALYLLVAGPAYDRLIGVVAVGGVHLGYLEFLSVGIMAIAALESSFITGSMFWLDRRLGMFAQLLAGPYTRDQYVASKLLSSILLATAFSAAAVIVAVCAAPDPRVAEALGRAMLAVPLAALAFSSLGMLAASYVRSNEAFNVLINAVLLPMFFLSTAYYPGEALPWPARVAASLNPLTHAVELMRALAFVPEPARIVGSLLPLLAFTAAMLALLTRRFRAMEVVD